MHSGPDDFATQLLVNHLFIRVILATASRLWFTRLSARATRRFFRSAGRRGAGPRADTDAIGRRSRSSESVSPHSIAARRALSRRSSTDDRKIANHFWAVECVPCNWEKLSSPPALTQRFVLSPKSCVDQSQ